MKKIILLTSMVILQACGTTPVAPKSEPAQEPADITSKPKPTLSKPSFAGDFKADYPQSAISAQQNGTCTASYDVNENGIPVNITISNCEPKGVFEQSCERQIQQLRYANNGESFTSVTHQCKFEAK